jgi:hypothetical protein
VELALPLPLELGVVILAVAADAAVPPLGREVQIEPGSDLLPEGFLLRRESKVHVPRLAKTGKE